MTSQAAGLSMWGGATVRTTRTFPMLAASAGIMVLAAGPFATGPAHGLTALDPPDRATAALPVASEGFGDRDGVLIPLFGTTREAAGPNVPDLAPGQPKQIAPVPASRAPRPAVPAGEPRASARQNERADPVTTGSVRPRSGGAGLSEAERTELFQDFLQWKQEKAR